MPVIWTKPKNDICELTLMQGQRVIYRVLVDAGELVHDPVISHQTRVVFGCEGSAYYGLPQSPFGSPKGATDRKHTESIIIDGEIVARDGVRVMPQHVAVACPSPSPA